MSFWDLCNDGDAAGLAAHLRRKPRDAGSAIQAIVQGEHPELLEVALGFKPVAWALAAALEQAAGLGRAALVRRLIAAGASVAADERESPLCSAAAGGHTEVVKLLLAAGADPDASVVDHDDPDGKLPLFAAIKRGEPGVVAALLDAGADVDKIGAAARRPLDVALAAGDAAIVALLRARGARVAAPEDLDLEQATLRGLVARVQALLPDASAEAREQALMAAIAAGQTAVAAAIVAHGAPASALIKALGQCIALDNPDLVPVLLAAGVDRDAATNYYHSPPIVLAAGRRRLAIVRTLLAAGVDLNARDQGGDNALAAARSAGAAEIVALLTNAGATARKPAAIAAAIKRKLAAHARDAWLPRLGPAGDEGDEPSRFGGRPWLLPGEAWPACGKCRRRLRFFAQIDLASAPAAALTAFGPGLLQLFHCTACDPYEPFTSAQRVRIIDRDAAAPAKVPRGTPLFPVRSIVGWQRAIKDYPHREADVALAPEEEALAFRLNRQGDKLGGWPNWVQDPQYPKCPRGAHRLTRLLLQIDSDRALPHTWGDSGAGYLLQCPRHREQVAFLWQCA